MVDQKTKWRFCGYCGDEYFQNWEEFDTHLDVCEKECAKRAKKPKPKKS